MKAMNPLTRKMYVSQAHMHCMQFWGPIKLRPQKEMKLLGTSAHYYMQFCDSEFLVQGTGIPFTTGKKSGVCVCAHISIIRVPV